MKLQQIYKKDITRNVNPAVYMEDINPETARVEIKEYVFTDDIIKQMYEVLSAIKEKKYSQDGIWVSGYFGSGKSHFLKYISYCLHKDYQDEALQRLEEETVARDPLEHPESTIGIEPSEIRDLCNWFKAAEVETLRFNLGKRANEDEDEHQKAKSFVSLFWNAFNGHLGYNHYNIHMAMLLERLLDKRGVYEQFKEKISEKTGMDWLEESETIIIALPSFIAETVKELAPDLNVDDILSNIKANGLTISVDTFATMLKNHLATKSDNYRLLFIADEVSMFIANNQQLLLQLQSIVEEMHTACGDKIWVACSAQQELTEILDNCQINKQNPNYGQITGRFPVKVSLKSTKLEYITQQRILEKEANAQAELGRLYDEKQLAITEQFNSLPKGYSKFADRQNFIDFYPFVPYQFALVTKVFDAFQNKEFIEVEVKGNQRSVLRVTHATAQNTKDQPVGSFISFDQFYKPMFAQLTNKGTNAISNAESVIQTYSDTEFGLRVVRVLFMICNLNESDRAVFGATAANVVTLLMQNVDTQKQVLVDKVNDVLSYLVDNNVLQEITSPTKATIYQFYTDDEREVVTAIKHQQIDNNFMATMLEGIFRKYSGINPRENYMTGSFNIAANIMNKNFWTNTNAPVSVEFVLENNYPDMASFMFNNPNNKLVFFLADLYAANKNLKNEFYWYCQVSKYLSENMANSTEREATNNLFRNKSNNTFQQTILPMFHKMFDDCPVISGQHEVMMAADKGDKRYKFAIQNHFSNIFTYASLVNSPSVPRDSKALYARIIAPKKTNEYEMMPLSPAEEEVSRYLDKQGANPVSIKDVVEKFAAIPYGWNEICTIFIMNELVRRNLRSFSYKNTPNAERVLVADKIMSNKADFTICPAQAIPAELVNNFTKSWKSVFNDMNIDNMSDPEELKQYAQGFIKNILDAIDNFYKEKNIGNSPFAKHIDAAQNLLKPWHMERDTATFFNAVINQEEEAKQILDNYKTVSAFINRADRFDIYKVFVRFVHENEDNWQYIPNEQETVNNLRAILTDDNPMRNLATYKALKERLEQALNKVKEDFRERIRVAYTQEDERLTSIAAEQGVTYHSRVDVRIQQKTQSNNIAVLQNNINTDEFFQEESAKLLSAKTGKTPPTVKIQTRSKSTLKTAEDVDKYLAGLRKQIMPYIDKGDEIIIL